MQSRRHEDFTIPSDRRDRGIELGLDPYDRRDRGIELGHDPYAMPRRDFLDRSPRSRRSLSPRKVEGSRRLLGVDGRRNSVERRDYGWDLGGGRGERLLSRSPPFGLGHKRPHYDEGVSSRDLLTPGLRQRNEFVDYLDTNADADGNTGLKSEFRFEHNASKFSREKDFDGNRLLGASVHGMSGQKLMVSKDDAVRDSFRLPKDLGTTSKYEEGDGRFSSSSANLDIGRFKDERARYPDPLLGDKLSAMESYREREDPMFYSTDVSYTQVPVSQSKDRIGTSQFEDFTGPSSGISRANFHTSYQDGMTLLTDEYPRNSAKLKEPSGFGGYGQRSILDSGRDANMEHKDLAHYRRDTFSPTRADQDYLNPRAGGRDSDEYGYPSDEFYRRMDTHERVDYDHTDYLRPRMRDPISERADNTEYTYRNLRDNSFLDRPSMQKQTLSNYLGASVSTASKGRQYLDSGSAPVEFGRRVPRDHEIPHFGVSKEHEISHLRLGYGFGRDAGPASHNERMRNSPEYNYELEMRRPAVRTHEMKAEELGTYDSSDRSLKRKYSADAEMNRYNSRNITPGKWYNTSRIRDLNNRNEEWTGEDSSVSFSSRNVGYDKKQYQREERTFVGADRHRVSPSEDWFSSHDSMEHVQEYSIKPYKPGGRYSKGHLRPGPIRSYNSYHHSKRHVLSKRNNVWIRGKDDNQVDVLEHEVDQSEDWVSSAKSEPPEDSEEFRQLVHKAFLIFSKKLNENPGVRKRYKEQGRAGSLFCIVCGRSLSKDFMDTQRLVMHAFMSHKVGLRAQHLGLHKAICVLLGWNSVVAPDVITWVPEDVPDAEARAQKEDLVLWPPVIIIHNSSIAENNVGERKVVTLEALGEFLRGKGFSGGKIKTYLGKPANHSVMVVKFLGTFSGLQDAERLHKYFVDNKHGRVEFEQVTSSSSKGKSSSNNDVGVMQGHSMEELVLYGYIGIAEDLDKVDMDTKRKSLIKSKKEIQDLANAAVKPE
ncbi:hypothetical protein LOK49_LG01G00377 [Camellia lanceoleosa]|uniref:Uncharacterized protein n=1 Tax=Camellia lanceoleosa TaxID=1840588 RepID=A0ACC0IX99_9ERIC|nr:hypothetical protein LOK49_LG01G00377 [Camellia lanceoleosa]